MRLLIQLLQIYVVLGILMLLYLVIFEEVSFSAALEPALVWPKTLLDMIRSPAV